MSTITFRVGLANKIVRGRAVGNLWGVSRFVDGRRNTWILSPQEDEALARDLAQRLNAAETEVAS